MRKQTYPLIMVAFLSMCAIAWGDEPPQKADYKTVDELRTHVQNRLKKLKQRLAQSNKDHLIGRTGPRDKKIVIGHEFLALVQKIADPDYPADKCRDEVISFIRECYTEISPTKKRIDFWYNAISQLAMYLYCLKDRIGGMYEVSKLSGFGPETLDTVVDNPKYGKDPELLKYELWCMRLRIFAPPESDRGWIGYQGLDIITRLTQLQSRYGTKNKRLKEFCMNHPFNKSTDPSIDSLTLPGTIPYTPGKKPQIDLDKWLYEYYSKLIQDKYDESPFLLNVYSHWGKKHFARLFVKAKIDNKELTSAVREKLLFTYLQMKDAKLRKKIQKHLKQSNVKGETYRHRLLKLQ